MIQNELPTWSWWKENYPFVAWLMMVAGSVVMGVVAIGRFFEARLLALKELREDVAKQTELLEQHDQRTHENTLALARLSTTVNGMQADLTDLKDNQRVIMTHLLGKH